MMIFLKTRLIDLKYLINWYLFYLTTTKSKKLELSIANPFKRQIDDAVDFTINNVGYFIGFLPQKNPSYLNEKIILEVGPGQDFGIPLVLMGYGLKKVILIDKFFYEWDENFHPEYYRALLKKAQQLYPNIDFKDLKCVIKNNSHVTEGLEFLTAGLENVSAIPDGSVDITFSNACFEHLVDTPTAIKELWRITRAGGIGFHQIDLRDHRNFDKPLEFLTMTDFIFNKTLIISNCCFGNRLRYTEFSQLFEDSGFELEFSADRFCEENYLNDILNRANSKYKKLPLDALRVLGGRFFLKKK